MDYIFGYGSLIDRTSRIKTSPNAVEALPVIVIGFRRFWGARTGVPGSSTTYLGLQHDTNRTCNGVVFKTSPDGLKDIDKREKNYKRQLINPKNVDWLCSEYPNNIKKLWVYLTTEEHKPDVHYPILQSYVDICLNGCLEIETEYPMAKKRGYFDHFLKSTDGWSRYWVNDRISPCAPHKMTPNAGIIDAKLSDFFPDEFAEIKIE